MIFTPHVPMSQLQPKTTNTAANTLHE